MPRYYYPGPVKPATRPLLRWAQRLALLVGGCLLVAVVPPLRAQVLDILGIIAGLLLVFWPLTIVLVLLLPVLLLVLALRPARPRPVRQVPDFTYLNPLEILLGLVAATVALLYYGLHEARQWVRRQRKPTRKPQE